MGRLVFLAVLFTVLVAGCGQHYDASDIAKVVDFEISPDEEKIAFSASTRVGNTDIWVIDIDGTNLKKLTFKDRSPSNHIARFFKKRKWRNFFRADMHSPEWTRNGRIAFCEEIIRHHTMGVKTVGMLQWTINPDGSDKKTKTDRDEIARRRSFDPINRAIISDQSDKYKKRIILKEGILWVLDYGEVNPKKLIQ